MAWNDLSVAQRSQMMNLFRHNGVYNLSEMRRLYDEVHPSSLEEAPSLTPVAPMYGTGGPKKSSKVLAIDVTDPKTGVHYSIDANGNRVNPQKPMTESEWREWWKNEERNPSAEGMQLMPYFPADNTRTHLKPVSGYIPAYERSPQERKVRLDDGVSGFIPILGDVLQGGQAVRDFKEGNYKEALLNAGLLMLPNIVEKPVKYGAKILRNSLRNTDIRSVEKLYEAANEAIKRGKSRVSKEAIAAGYEDFPEFFEFLQRTGMQPSQEAVEKFAKQQGTSVRGVGVPHYEGYRELDTGEIEELTHHFLTTSPIEGYELQKKYGLRQGADALGSSGIYSSNSLGVANSNANRYFKNTRYGLKPVIGKIETPIIYDRSLPIEAQLRQIRAQIFNYDDVLGPHALGLESEVSRAADKAGYRIGDHYYTDFVDGLPVHERTTLNPKETAKLREKFSPWSAPHSDGYGLYEQPKRYIDNQLFIPAITTKADREQIANLLSWIRREDGSPMYAHGGKIKRIKKD